MVCPGICNSSEKSYIRTFIQHSIDRGFRVIVLNHIGSLPSVKLTSPKIFTYGRYHDCVGTVVMIIAAGQSNFCTPSMSGFNAGYYLHEWTED